MAQTPIFMGPINSKLVYKVLFALDPTDPMKNETFIYKNVKVSQNPTFMGPKIPLLWVLKPQIGFII